MSERAAALLFVATATALCMRTHRRRRLAPPTFMISLRRRPAKRAAALARTDAAGLLGVRIFDAVDGRDLGWDDLRARGVRPYAGWRLADSAYRFYNRDLKWGEIGCALSHHGVWSAIVESGLPFAIVLEDDADFAPGFTELLTLAIQLLEGLVATGAAAPPDLLYLARKACWPRREARVTGAGAADAPASGAEIVRPAFSYKCTAYVLWKSGAEKLLARTLSLSRLARQTHGSIPETCATWGPCGGTRGAGGRLAGVAVAAPSRALASTRAPGASPHPSPAVFYPRRVGISLGSSLPTTSSRFSTPPTTPAPVSRDQTSTRSSPTHRG